MSVTFFGLVNNASASLASPMNGSSDPADAVLGAGEGAQFPASNFPISIDSEILLCTSRTNDTLTCSRAQEGTIKAPHATSAIVQQRITAAILKQLQDAINDLIDSSDAFDELEVGASGNTTHFDETGHMVMSGDARPWDDLRIEPTVKATGAGHAAYAAWKTNYYLPLFPDGAVNDIFFSIQMPHDWDPSVDPHLHIHWVANGNGSGANKFPEWNCTYSWGAINGVMSAEQTCAAARVPVGKTTGDTIAADNHYITEFAPLDGSAVGADSISSCLVGRIWRTASPANDYADDVWLLYIDMHYQKNSLGSTDELTK